MYPTHLNLLPPPKRATIQRMIYVQYTKNIFEIIIIFLCLSGILLLAGEWTLERHFNAFVSTLATISSQQAEKNKTIKDANAIFAKIELLQKKYELWTPIIRDITNAIPDHVTLTGLTLNGKEKTYTLDGMADTRDDILLLQKNLRAINGIFDAIVPVSQLTAKEHITFSITATTK